MKRKPDDSRALIARVAQTIENHRMLKPGETVWLAVSGGPDSMCMLDVFMKLSVMNRYRLIVCHINHSIRGRFSDSEQEFVSAYCTSRNIEFRTRTVDVPRLCAERRIGLEEAARILRYEQLSQLAGETGKIALAHHRDDQAETVLLHLFRGSGIKGLGGIRPVSDNRIRPFIECTRQQIHAYLEREHIPFCVDSSNDELNTVRNLIRHRILPFVAEVYGSDVSDRLCRTAMLCASEDSFVEEMTRKKYEQIVIPGGLPCAEIARVHHAQALRFIRMLYEDVRGTRQNLSYAQTQSLLDLSLAACEGKTIRLPEGYEGFIDNGMLRILPALHRSQEPFCPQRDLSAQYPFPSDIPCKASFPLLGLEVFVKFVEKREDMVYNANTYCFPADRIREAVFRYRRQGDRIRPNSKSGSKTLKKYLTEKKVPAKQKSAIPVLACGSEVLWVPGVGGCVSAATSQDSGTVCIRIEETPANN